MFAASKTDSVSGGPPDDKFNYVTMLLHGDGTNGAQNNTFLDSGPNTFTITRNGNTTQGSFGPYGSNWSNFFGTAQHKLSTTGMTAFGSDFTLELWIFPTSFNDYNTIFDSRGGDGDANGVVLGLTSAAKVYIYTNGGFLLTTTTAISLNTWTHIALVRSGSGSGNVKVYINGVADATTATYTTSFTSTAPSIGDDWNTRGSLQYFGYLSNLRAVTSALYTGTFTPSTTLLTAISGTVLLTCQSNRFIDNSSSALTMTVTGSPRVQRFNPFGTSTAYSTSVIGGSGYFDGTGDYLGCGSQSAYAFGTSNFTMECWAYVTSFASYNSLTGSRTSSGDSTSTNYSFGIDSGGGVYFYSGGFLVTSSAGAIKLNSWNHIALVRSGTGSNQSVLYINGVSAGTGTISNNLSGTSFAIGGLVNGDEPFTGYITNVRLNNTALYSTTFTPPTAPLTAVSGTSLLTNMTNGAIFDNAMMNNLETAGNAQISTSVKKYGTGSLAFDGSGDILKIPFSPNLTMQGDFTAECWVYITSAPEAYGGILAFSNDSEGVGWNILIGGTTTKFHFNVAMTYTDTSTSMTLNSWTHLALVRSGSTGKLYINGVADANTVTTSATATCPTNPQIGSYPLMSDRNFFGYIDDIRITKGFARYTTTFTPPTAAFSDTGPY